MNRPRRWQLVSMDAFYLALLLYVAAVVIAFVDLFLPSGGLLVIMSLLAGLGCVLFGFRSGHTMGMVMLIMVLVTIPFFAVAAIHIWPRTPIARRIILAPPEERELGEGQLADPLQALVGRVMLTDSTLLPTGQLRLGHRRINAVAEDGIIEVGVRVKVIGVRDRNLVVRATQEPLSSEPVSDPGGATAKNDERRGTSPAQLNSSENPQNLLDRPAEELGLDSLDS